jgi:PAS domain S-box-containing protein
MTDARIMVVEDERITARNIQQRLTGLGYAVTAVVASGEDAIRKAEETRPDLILMDIRLEGEMDGVEAAEHIRTRFHIPVIYLTAYADDSMLRRARATEPFGYLLKPFDARELHATIQMALYRRKMEQALRESEERYRGIFESANDIIATFTLDGIITTVNRGTEVLLGWPRKEVIGRHFSRFLTPASVEAIAERERRIKAGGRVAASYEVEVVRKDGRIVPCEIRARFVRNHRRQPVSILAILRDISERKTLERQRIEFLAMLTHDIRNPLGVVLGYTDLLLDEALARGLDDMGEMLRRVQSNVLTVYSLVTNYLDFSKLEAGQVVMTEEPVDLNALLGRVAHQYETEARLRGVTFASALQDGLPAVAGSPLALERVFANLVHNALKVSPGGGQVTIATGRRGHEAVVTVADTGPGIAAEELPRLFEKYHQVQRSDYRAGYGLGLFIVKSLVEAQGGRIEVETALGAGTRFLVFLPVMGEDEQAGCIPLEHESGVPG